MRRHESSRAYPSPAPAVKIGLTTGIACLHLGGDAEFSFHVVTSCSGHVSPDVNAADAVIPSRSHLAGEEGDRERPSRRTKGERSGWGVSG